MSPKAANRLKRFEAAVRAHEMLNAASPEDQARIEQFYRHSKQSLRSFIGNLEAVCARFEQYREGHP